jgi:hypothetical protein
VSGVDLSHPLGRLEARIDVGVVALGESAVTTPRISPSMVGSTISTL